MAGEFQREKLHCNQNMPIKVYNELLNILISNKKPLSYLVK